MRDAAEPNVIEDDGSDPKNLPPSSGKGFPWGSTGSAGMGFAELPKSCTFAL